MRRLGKLLKISGVILLVIGSILIVIGYIGILLKDGFGELREVMSPFNLSNFIAVIITLSPAAILYFLWQCEPSRSFFR